MTLQCATSFKWLVQEKHYMKGVETQFCIFTKLVYYKYLYTKTFFKMPNYNVKPLTSARSFTYMYY